MNIDNFTPTESTLKNKIIAVTGAGDGIGKTCAKTFAKYGATVILMGRTTAKLEQVYDEIMAESHAQPVIQPVDLEHATEADYIELAQAIEANFGKLDGLLHNAALLGQRTPIANYSATTWQQVMNVNINAEFLLTKAFLPVLEKADNASILFTTSSVGRKGRAYWGAYAVSKFAVEGLSQVLAQELEETSNIRVNCINPGATRTRMRASAFPAESPSSVKSPEDMMNSYVYLFADESIGQTGNSFDV